MKLEVFFEKPLSNAHETPILFVHGMWHGAWCWAENFLPYFAKNGYPAYALSLRCHCGSEDNGRLTWNSLDDYVEDVAQVAKGLAKAPVVVGHSMGGAIVQKYLVKHDAPAAVLLAACPPFGIVETSLRYFLHHPFQTLKVLATLKTYHTVGTFDVCKDTLFSADMPDREVRKYFERLQNESYRAYMEMNLFRIILNPKKIKTPIQVIGAQNDVVITPRQAQKTARIYHTQAEILPDMAHDMMLEKGWQNVADRILGWLGARNIV